MTHKISPTRKSTLFLVFILFHLGLMAQSVPSLFVNHFGTAGSESVSANYDDTDNAIFCLGEQDHTAILSKFDNVGNLLWTKSYADQAELKNWFKLDNGDFLLIGESNISSTNRKIYIVRTDYQGNLLWDKVLTRSGRNRYARAIASVNEGQDYFYIRLWRSNGGTVDDMNIIKIDENANVVWSKEYYGTFDEEISGLTALGDGSLVGVGVIGAGGWPGLIFRIDVDGNILFKRTYKVPSAYTTVFRRIIPLTSGDFAVVGTYRYSSGSTRYAFVIRLDSQFNVTWKRTLQISTNSNISGLMEDGGGNLYVLNYSPDTQRMLKYTAAGDLVWAKRFLFDGITYIHPLLTKTQPKRFLMTMNSDYFNQGMGGTDFYLASLDTSLVSCITEPLDVHSNSFSMTTGTPTLSVRNTSYTASTLGTQGVATLNQTKICSFCPYTIPTQTTRCDDLTHCADQPKICIPLQTIDSIEQGIIGIDFTIAYDESLLSPTGIVSLGDVVLDGSLEADYYINYITDPGKVHVSVYYTAQAPTTAEFVGTGDVACVEFLLNSNFVAGTSTDISASGILESYELSIEEQCATSGSLSLEDDNIQEGTLLFWNDENRPLRYDANNTTAYLPTEIVGVDTACANAGPSVTPDLNGYFEYDSNNGSHLAFDRDIDGGNLGGSCPTDVMSVINGMDCYWTSLVTTLNSSWVPNPFQMIAMDVNMDGAVAAGDITHIQNRIIQNTCEFPQAWNYPNPTDLSKDWRFINQNLLDNAADMQVSINYPSSDGQGYDKLNVPEVPDCLTILPEDINGFCSYIDTMVYSGILLGDTNGSWEGNNSPVPLKIASNTITFDLENLIAEDMANCIISVPVYYTGVDAFRAMDFTMDYAEDKLEFLKVEYAMLNNTQAGMAWNDQNGQRLLFTSYAKQQGGITSNAPLFRLHFRLKNREIEPADLGALVAYFNGTDATTEVLGASANCTISSIDEPRDGMGAISVYPTLVNDRVFVDWSNKQSPIERLDLYDVHGRLLQSVDTNGRNEGISLSLDHLPTGIYFLHIDGYTAKIVKQ